MAYNDGGYVPPFYQQQQQQQAQSRQNSQGWDSQYQQSDYQNKQDRQPYVNVSSVDSPHSPRQDYHQQYNNMTGNGPYQSHQRKPLSATFYPGSDDFYMPEVISPTPQRIMPEVPSNMQEGLANLELEARNHRASSQSTNSSIQSPYGEQFPTQTPLPRDSSYSSINQRLAGQPGFTASYEHTNASAYQNIDNSGGSRVPPKSPKSSPFPRPRNAGPNVPLSDDEKEEVLERARPLVLKSTDPEMQLAWAQDALSWVEVASQSIDRREDTSRSGTPPVERQLRTDAISIVNFLAEQGHPKAEFMKAMWLEFGKFGYRVDKKESYLGFQRAAKKGYARAEYRIGMQFETSQDPIKAIEHYQRGVAMHDSAASYRLGMMTLLGQHGMPQNYQHGVDMIRFAADTADENAPQGAYVYGMLLARELPNINVPEEILPYDLNDAKLFIEKAAYLGFAKAQLKIAQAYELCQLACEFDPALSLHYNALAARQGEPEADMAISKWFLCGYEGIFEKNEELAFTYAKRAASTKMPTAEFALGYFYEIGMYVPTNLQLAEEWYAKSADHGNKDALGRIESIRKNNTLSKFDHEKVALNRIKSQYGSRRGQRPAHLTQRANPMPSMAEDRPDIRNPPFARPVSAAPYPEDDHLGPSHVPTYYNARPQSGPQADRPSSAFGIKPQNLGPTELQRPYSSMDTLSVQNGRRDQRVVSSPDLAPQLRSRDNSPNRPTSQANMGRPPNFEQAGNYPRQQTPNMNRPYPQQAPMQAPVNQGYGDPRRPVQQQGYNNTIPRRDPAANIRPERGSSVTPGTPMSAGPMQNSGRNSARPMQGQTMSSRQNTAPGMQPVPSQASWTPPPQSMSAQGNRPSNTSTPAPQAPKKAGPATFEEMGIPAGKTDGDCIVM